MIPGTHPHLLTPFLDGCNHSRRLPPQHDGPAKRQSTCLPGPQHPPQPARVDIFYQFVRPSPFLLLGRCHRTQSTAVTMQHGSGRAKITEEDIKLRTSAAMLYINAQGDEAQKKRAAGEAFVLKHGKNARSKPANFCQQWGERLEESGTVLDAPRSGRPLALQPAAAREASRIFKKGAGSKPTDKFTSVSTACTSSEALEAIRQSANDGEGCSHRTLRRAMFRADPMLRVKTIKWRPKISLQIKKERKATSKWNLRRFRENRGYFRCAELGVAVRPACN